MATTRTFEENCATADRAAATLRRRAAAAPDRRRADAERERRHVRQPFADRRRAPGHGGERRLRRHRRRGAGRRRRVRRLVGPQRAGAQADPARRRRPDRRAGRRDRRGRMRRHRPDRPVHERGRDPRCRELPVLRRPRARRGQRALDARRAPSELLQPVAARPGRGDHTVEHAVHAVDVEDRTGARGRLHGGAQTRRMVSPAPRRCCPRSPSRRGCRPAC